MSFATVELLGVQPDGSDYTVRGLLVVKLDEDRMLLDKRDDVDRERVGTATITRRRSYGMASVKPGTAAVVTIDGLAYATKVVRGYGRRLSFRVLGSPTPVDEPQPPKEGPA